MSRTSARPAWASTTSTAPGPGVHPHLYDKATGYTFLVEPMGTPGKFDVPRNSQNVALIGDPRDDENLIISQLQLAFLKFHNAVADYVKTKIKLKAPGEIFAEAQRIVRWHYQWIIVHEFLTKTCGEDVVDDVLAQRPQVLQMAQRAVHPGRVLGRRLPLRPQPGAPVLPRQLHRRRRRHAVLRA